MGLHRAELSSIRNVQILPATLAELTPPAGMELTDLPVPMLCAQDTQGTPPPERPADVYQQAADKAAAAETGDEDPAITQVPTRPEQIDEARRRGGGASIIHEAKRWISEHLTSALGSLSVRTV